MLSALRNQVCWFTVLCAATGVCAQSTPTPLESRAIKAFEAARANPLQLHAFLVGMPKGADLHMHLSGAVYAETFIAEAAADGLCVNTKTMSLVDGAEAPRGSTSRGVCPQDGMSASSALKDQRLYDSLVDSFSMRSFVPTPGISGHDQFFNTFARFGGVSKAHVGEWVDEVASRAAAQNEQYLEIMETPPFSKAAHLGYEIGWPRSSEGNSPSEAENLSREALEGLREKLLAHGLRDELTDDREEFHRALAERKRLEHCGAPDASPACAVKVRFLGQVLRAFPPQQVFAQTLLYFELAASDPDVAGINFVQPEDSYLAMREYHRQMLMLDYLHSVYPKVHISLHAGELAPGLVPPSGLSFHIREAIELGHAERIGHGVDVMYEREPAALLKEMAARHVMVEINLTSNDVILGVTTNHHSLPAYRAAHVPVALSTDDEGVSRIDLTHEYMRASVDFGLGYLDLKQMARTGMEHTFLPGASLWARPDDFTHTVADCRAQAAGAEDPSAKCLLFLRASDKAAEQWELEHRFKVFESELR